MSKHIRKRIQGKRGKQRRRAVYLVASEIKHLRMARDTEQPARVFRVAVIRHVAPLLAFRSAPDGRVAEQAVAKFHRPYRPRIEGLQVPIAGRRLQHV